MKISITVGLILCANAAFALAGENAYGPGVHSDATGRPFTLQDNGGQKVQSGGVRMNGYGAGVHVDQFGRAVRAIPQDGSNTPLMLNDQSVNSNSNPCGGRCMSLSEIIGLFAGGKNRESKADEKVETELKNEIVEASKKHPAFREFSTATYLQALRYPSLTIEEAFCVVSQDQLVDASCAKVLNDYLVEMYLPLVPAGATAVMTEVEGGGFRPVIREDGMPMFEQGSMKDGVAADAIHLETNKDVNHSAP